MGFAVEGPPLGRKIQESFYFPTEERGLSSHLPFPRGDPWCPLIEGPCSPVSMEEFLEMKKARDQLQAEKTELEMSVARIQMANQEIKRKIEDQDKRHALVVKHFEIDTAYYGKTSQALESSTREHDITKEKLARALRVIEDEKRRQILVKTQREARAKVLSTEWEAKLKIKEEENAKTIDERDHYLAERDHYFQQMKIHQKEIGRLQQENTELRFAMKFTKMVDDEEPSVGLSAVLMYDSRTCSALLIYSGVYHSVIDLQALFAFLCQFLTCLIDAGMMNPPNADILDLKEKMSELISVMQEFALGQKPIAEKVERIESWLRMGEIQGNAPPSGVKKPFGYSQRKKEGESSDVYTQRGHGRDRYHPYTATVKMLTGNRFSQQQQQSPQQRTQRGGCQVRRRMTDRQFDKSPVAYAFLFKRLKDLGLVQPRTLAPVGPDQRLAGYNENIKCEFHSGAPGHSIEGCKAFKHVVQDLVDSKAINFAPTPNVNANPMSGHGPMRVNMMSEDKRKIEVADVNQLRTLMSVVKRHLMKSGVFPGCDNRCAACTVTANGCVMLREAIQRMLDEGRLRFEKVDCGEEEIFVSQLSSFKYVEMDGEIFETPSQAFETVKVENAVFAKEEKKPSISSYKQASEVVKSGEALGWGKMIDIAAKEDRFEVGYQWGQGSSRKNKGRRQPFTFTSVGMIDPDRICAVGEEIDSDCELDLWIKSCVPGNWKASKIIIVTHREE
ncbi:hypothetical protein KIW84_012787 [Lathyrus oleraceus]|uniref:Uncharacterized protein n=1 Tax=Pisum sativum TaxID=3888 RepID=A0A9D5GX41_PEA|nr:hypothetical protein KIW84_012787 [Pisum sativum]